ncbi:SGNH/GDSL hydrolase family protein [uncultured Bacteroides sp.]|uniref:SGNH/GDSL hydrolase family protein n=1 Tax=uncultured Bacteroides sp. TaxID=162156 RepID=UPI0034572AD3
MKMKPILRKLLFMVSCLPALIGHAQTMDTCPSANGLKGKRIAVIGDSYVKNHKEPVENTWHYAFARKHGMEYLNYGRNGNSIAYSSPRWGEAMYIRYKEMADSLDYIVVIGGHNDAFKLDSIGGIDNFKEKLAILCEGLVEKYPTAKIFFFTRWTCKDFKGSDSEKVVDAMLEVCGNYSIPIFDCARQGGIYAASDTFRKIYFQGAKDTAHLNKKGHERFLKVAESFLLQY